MNLSVVCRRKMVGEKWAVGREEGHGQNFLSPFKLQESLPGTHSNLPSNPSVSVQRLPPEISLLLWDTPWHSKINSAYKAGVLWTKSWSQYHLSLKFLYPSQQTCMRSKNCPRLDLKIKDAIQERYIFNFPLAQCHEPPRTANPAINCVVKNREVIWRFGFGFLQISSSRLLALDHWSYISWTL